MKVGIIGLGIVGTAVKTGLTEVGHEILVHDIKLNTQLENLLTAEICFICVSTPAKENGKCDTSIVESIVTKLYKYKYKGIVAIKSTVEPGTTQRLINKFPDLAICFVPEFLRERCAIADFTSNHDLCVIGTTNNDIYNKVKYCHGNIPEKFVKLTPTEAELVKYFNNLYNATLITFANCFYEICSNLNVDYSNVKNAVVNRKHINDSYIDCNVNLRGFGGVCLPKDVKAIAWLIKERNLDIEFFEMILKENRKYKTTVFNNMREK